MTPILFFDQFFALAFEGERLSKPFVSCTTPYRFPRFSPSSIGIYLLYPFSLVGPRL